MVSHYDAEIKRRLDDLPGNGKLTSPDIQNEILQIAASLLIRKIKTELHDETDTFYAILADECKDVSKRELVAVCIRYMHKAAASKVSPGISTFFDVINNLHSFMTGTRRHARFIEIQKELPPGKPTLELERSCDVRWSS
ncbi:hypothetical protein JOQ06_011187, partial [Pogonophryne albipinna]